VSFDPPVAVEHTLPGGVTVFFLRDATLPLVDVYARFASGYGRFPRTRYAPGTALPSLLRSGGAGSLSPEAWEVELERFAIQTSFGGSGDAVTSSLNTLAVHLDTAVALWAAALQAPAFDSATVEVWRGQELENVRRQGDDPGRLAYAEFNRLMYGDHPVGWEMEASDLSPELLNRESLAWVHRQVVCRENLILGVAGAVEWERIRPRLEALVEGLPGCPEPPPARDSVPVGAAPGVYLIPRPVAQSVIVAAHPVALKQDTSTAYFASRIGNSILGAAGMSSRLMQTIRTREGLAYGASSLWTTPRRYDGLLGSTTRVRGEATARAVELLLTTMAEMAAGEAPESEVATRVAELVNGFVFNFQSPSQIVTRRMAYRAAGLPDDWLQAYVRGIQAVTPEAIRATFAEHLDLDRMVILVVGDPETFSGGAEGLERFGPVRILEPAN
jgi:zinc protease